MKTLRSVHQAASCNNCEKRSGEFCVHRLQRNLAPRVNVCKTSRARERCFIAALTATHERIERTRSLRMPRSNFASDTFAPAFSVHMQAAQARNSGTRSIDRDVVLSRPVEEREMPRDIFPHATPERAATRKRLAPATHDAFTNFSKQVFAEGSLTTKTKQLIAVAVAHVTQCPYCIRGHTKAALRNGASAEEIMESIWVASEMRAGAAYAHAALALDTIDELTNEKPHS